MTLFIIGYMFCGKSTVGKRLAQRLGYDFVDTDDAFEERYRTTIASFFKHFDEPLFRKLETELLHEAALRDNTVVACGGGTPCHHDNMDFILAHGTSVYLRMTPEEAFRRLRQSHRPERRPLLAALDTDEQRALIARQLTQREQCYRKATLTVDADTATPDNLVEQISRQL
ncbi:MAG: shikimate kinase [Bacteroidales bacterium]|nr:shikimate kinase [Bacteroidales bacterium]